MSGLVTGYELISTFYPPLSRLDTGGHGMSQHVTGKAVTKGVLHISEHNCKCTNKVIKKSFWYQKFNFKTRINGRKDFFPFLGGSPLFLKSLNNYFLGCLGLSQVMN